VGTLLLLLLLLLGLGLCGCVVRRKKQGLTTALLLV